jgi:serine protease Do
MNESRGAFKGFLCRKSHRISKLGVSVAGNASNRPKKQVTFSVPTIPRPTVPKLKLSLIGATVAVFVVGLLGGVSGAWLESHNSDNQLLVGSDSHVSTPNSQRISKIAQTVGPSVVSVNVSITSAQATTPFDFFGPNDQSGGQSEEAAGTGIILTKSGYVMTNRHVVPQGTTKVSVTLSDGTELKNVSVVGRTSDNDTLDVAFLKINDAKGHTLKPATLGNSAAMQVGDDVVAIGNALGQFQNTVTSGVISGYGRSVQASDNSGQSAENLDNLFQTDAAINEGNSGGPLVNAAGQVIGMNTAIAGNAQNIGFAIPINDVKGLIEQILSSGKFARPYLGVHYVSLTADIAAQYDLSRQQGAFVFPSQDPSSPSVVADSPADKAGVKENDIIVAVDGQSVDQNHSLTSRLAQHKPGDRVKLTVVRGKDTIQLTATLSEMPANTSQ